MKKIIALIILSMLLIPATCFSWSRTNKHLYPRYGGLTGGGTGSVDSITGASLMEFDRVIAYDTSGNTTYFYNVINTGATTENAPFIIVPDDHQAGGSGSGTSVLRLAGVSGDTIFGKTFVLDTTTFESSDVVNWNTAYGWGDHGTAGYLTGNTAYGSGDSPYFINAVIEGQLIAFEESDEGTYPTPFVVGELRRDVNEAFDDIGVRKFLIGESYDATNYHAGVTGAPTLWLNIDKTEFNPAPLNASTASGTDADPIDCYFVLKQSGSTVIPVFVATNEPTYEHIKVGRLLLGSSDASSVTIWAGTRKRTYSYELGKHVYDRFFDQGALYQSGFVTSSDASGVSIDQGTFDVIFDLFSCSGVSSVKDGFFYINSDGDYQQVSAIGGITGYSDSGVVLGNNKFMNLIWGIVPASLDTESSATPFRIFVMAQREPSAEYGSFANANADGENVLVGTPSVTLLKRLFIPIARTIVKNTGGTYTLQQWPDLKYHLDIRNTAIGGGAAGVASTSLWDDDGTKISPKNSRPVGLTGVTVSGFSWLQTTPTDATHGANKAYVDNNAGVGTAVLYIDTSDIINHSTATSAYANFDVGSDNRLITGVSVWIAGVSGNTENITAEITFHRKDDMDGSWKWKTFTDTLVCTGVSNANGAIVTGGVTIPLFDNSGFIEGDVIAIGVESHFDDYELQTITEPVGNIDTGEGGVTVSPLHAGYTAPTMISKVIRITDAWANRDLDGASEMHVSIELLDTPNSGITIYTQAEK